MANEKSNGIQVKITSISSGHSATYTHKQTTLRLS